ncbi:VCBS repeat-containing protein [Flavihumibacter rivuli]|uniref:VCBS repeat-containing protein n=1 Tax=Flavihumibacter rivuli TaxID=2838156 RepID=UPI001BDDCEE9|nr:VCBS repeat-containing protein [Flavihumibacter rivuli]ULQ56399.1 VCBS repeat-containing protein [Flavihumibacter rivuli]
MKRSFSNGRVFSGTIMLTGFLMVLACACNKGKEAAPVFSMLRAERTGLDFANNLQSTPDFNMFKYMYFYNGAGVGAGDFNNDGRIDVFFASNQGRNRLFLNDGGLQFKDVTEKAGIPDDGAWSTGVSVVDINDDGLLDIYVCRVGQYEVLKGKNQLLVCTGIKDGVPVFEDRAAVYGVDFSGFSTQAAFFDHDLDGDLDMYLMNHSVHHNGTFGERKNFLGTSHPLSGDKFFRNDNGRFKEVTNEVGINSSVIGYGLGIAISDINADGYPDIYIGNDFHENDYLYINQGDGTFKDELTSRIRHTSQFSMGVDIADINNDAAPEIITMDMLPEDPYILRRSLGEDEYNLFQMKVRYGYNHQYARNNLQLNDGLGQFRETGLYSGVYATDWSWSPLWLDFDNDGQKDLFVSNGIPKRLNDIDYVNYVSNEEVQSKIREGKMGEKEMALIDKFPQIKLPNRFFLNRGEARFEDVTASIGNNLDSYSNGAAYADFDNDGDVDVVVNNIDDKVFLYENHSSNKGKVNWLDIQLKGPAGNNKAIGAMAVAYTSKGIQTLEKFPVRGFQSSMEVPLHLGLGTATLDSLLLVWPDNTYEKVRLKDSTGNLSVTYRKGLPVFDRKALLQRIEYSRIGYSDETLASGIAFNHTENLFVEFNREPLIPRMLSKEGPAVASGDLNGDGLDDLFLGNARNAIAAIYLQQPDGKFTLSMQPVLNADSAYEDVDAVMLDINGDKANDLVVVSGGNEFYGKDSLMQPRAYLNDGKGKLSKLPEAFKGIFLTGSCIAPHDVNGDGAIDLFIGARAVPFEYGVIPTSYLLLNDGKGKFTIAPPVLSAAFNQLGLVKQARWVDLDGDKDKDLLLALEWDGIIALMNEGGKFARKVLSGQSGWWNTVDAVDLDNDGDLDIVAGNLGLNSRLKANAKEPVRLYVNDFDGNGKKEQVLTYYLHGQELPFANKADLEKQMPLLKKKFLYAGDFAKASLEEVFGADKLKSSQKLEANNFSSMVLLNNGSKGYVEIPLPWKAQLSPLMTIAVMDVNGDGLPDILPGFNFYENTIQMGRNDADFGGVLMNKGKGRFDYVEWNGAPIEGEIRRIVPVRLKSGETILVYARNNGPVSIIKPGK